MDINSIKDTLQRIKDKLNTIYGVREEGYRDRNAKDKKKFFGRCINLIETYISLVEKILETENFKQKKSPTRATSTASGRRRKKTRKHKKNKGGYLFTWLRKRNESRTQKIKNMESENKRNECIPKVIFDESNKCKEKRFSRYFSSQCSILQDANFQYQDLCDSVFLGIRDELLSLLRQLSEFLETQRLSEDQHDILIPFLDQIINTIYVTNQFKNQGPYLRVLQKLRNKISRMITPAPVIINPVNPRQHALPMIEDISAPRTQTSPASNQTSPPRTQTSPASNQTSPPRNKTSPASNQTSPASNPNSPESSQSSPSSHPNSPSSQPNSPSSNLRSRKRQPTSPPRHPTHGDENPTIPPLDIVHTTSSPREEGEFGVPMDEELLTPAQGEALRETNLVELKSKCQNASICLSLNYNYDDIMELFFYFQTFQDLKEMKHIGGLNQPSSNSTNLLLVYETVIRNTRYQNYGLMKIPLNRYSDNLGLEYLVGKLLVNTLCRHFPIFTETYSLYFLPEETEGGKLNLWEMEKISFDEPIETFLRMITMKPENLRLVVQYYDKFQSLDYFMRYTWHHVRNVGYELPFLLYQVYVTLYKCMDVFTDYDLHLANVGLVSLPYGKYIQYHYHCPATGRNVSFKSRYIVKIIDYGRCYFKGKYKDSVMSSRYLIIEKFQNVIDVNQFAEYGIHASERDKNEFFIDVSQRNVSSGLLLAVRVREYSTLIQTICPSFVNLLNRIKFDGLYGTMEMVDNPNPNLIVNVKDAANAIEEYLLQNRDNIMDMNETSYGSFSQMGELIVYLEPDIGYGQFMEYRPTEQPLVFSLRPESLTTSLPPLKLNTKKKSSLIAHHTFKQSERKNKR